MSAIRKLPSEIRTDDFPKLIGPTARITEAYVEITKDALSFDLEKKLPWYRELAARQKRGGILGHPQRLILAYNMFVQE